MPQMAQIYTDDTTFFSCRFALIYPQIPQVDSLSSIFLQKGKSESALISENNLRYQQEIFDATDGTDLHR
jgi:hypothetical protein